MASTGIIQRRYNKHELIANPPLIGEIVFALDTEEFGTIINGEIVWKSFEDLVKSVNGKQGNVQITKSDFDLGNVDNVSDLDKPISNAVQALFNLHISANNPHNITKETINLSNVDNTADLDKPVSDATQVALDGKLDKNSKAKDSERLAGYLPDYYLNTSTGYTQQQIDDKLSTKANMDNVYIKSESDNLFASRDYVRVEGISIAVGTAPAGTTFNGTIQDALDKILYYYAEPTFTSFNIQGIDSPKQYDTVITSGDYVCTWSTSETQNISENTIVISRGNDNFTINLPNTGSATITIPSDISSSTVGTEVFTISATNTHSQIFSKTFEIQWVEPVNNPTVVNDVHVSTNLDVPINIDVIANDTDSDSTVSRVQTVGTPVSGTAAFEADGTITYTPNSGYVGSDTFTYTNTEGTIGHVYVEVQNLLPMFYGIWEGDADQIAPRYTLSDALINSEDFTELQGKTSADGTYVINAKKYDSEDPGYDANAGYLGEGAYHTFVYPKAWNKLTLFEDPNATFNHSMIDVADITLNINGNPVIYQVQRSANVQWAGDYTFITS